MPEDRLEDHSEYPELVLPEEFKSDIPEHLLNGASEQDQYIMRKLSENTQRGLWLCKGVLDTNGHVRKTNGQVKVNKVKIQEHEEILKAVKDVLPMIQSVKKAYDVIFGSKLMMMLFGAGLGFIAFVLYPYILTKQFSELLPILAKFFGS
jgi:hypothetical protein